MALKELKIWQGNSRQRHLNIKHVVVNISVQTIGAGENFGSKLQQ